MGWSWTWVGSYTEGLLSGSNPMDAYNFIRYRRVALTANETIEVKRPGFVKSNVGAERAGK